MVLRRVLPSICVCCALLLTACGTSGPGTPTHTPLDSVKASGSVHGGQQPVVGATIQLYTVGTTADGSPATPLLTSTVTSDSTGSFTITGLYSCTNATQVYIVATGGNPGLSTANPNIALMAALGPCSSLSSSTFISINELTSVAAVTALAPFMTSATAIGSSSSDATALANAFTLANQLVDTTTGTAPGNNLPSGYTAPVAELDTLADIISACINSTGGSAGDGSLCGNLFSYTTVPPNPPPTNTIAALLNIVNNPSQNTEELFALVPPTPPFQPTLTSAPANFQIALIPPADSGPVTLTSPATFTVLGALEDLTLSNQGNTPLTITSITESDSGPPAAPYFTIAANNCGTTLAAQSSCTITVSSSNSPVALGTPLQAPTLTGTLTVNDNAASGPQTAALSSADLYEIAIEDYPLLVTSTGIVSFAPTQVGSTAALPFSGEFYYQPLPYAVLAPPIPLTISGANPGDFSISTSSTGLHVPSASCNDNYVYTPTAQQCQIAFSFKPTATGLRTARVSLDPSYGTPTGQYILLKGTGVGTGASFSLNTNSIALSNYLPSTIDPNSVGSSTVTLTNTGTTTVNLAASFTGAAAPYLSAAVSNCSSVAAQATCQFTVRFAAPAAGNYSGNLVLTDANSTFSLTVPVLGTTSFWTPVANPSHLSFGLQTVGTTSAASTFVIADSNGYPLGDPYTVALQPSSNFVLTQGSTCPASTTQTCTLAIAFAPQTAGPINEIATITDQTTGLESQLALSGNGGGATYTLSTTAINFTPASIGTFSTPVPVTLTNTGSQAVTISSISIPNATVNNFTETNNCSSVAVAATCTINVVFATGLSGTQSATLQITSNAINSPTAIVLSGTATVSSALQISPSSLSLITGAPAQSITITNAAPGPITISSVAISGATGGTFTITANNCIAILNAGASCTVSLTGVTTSTASGSLVITSSTPGSPQSVALSAAVSSGGGGGSTTATLTPTSAQFNIWGANEDFTLTNTGSAALSIASTSTDTTLANNTAHTYAVTNTTCGATLAASATCTYGVASLPTLAITAYPQSFGVGTGDFYVNDGAGQQSASIVTDDGSYLYAVGQVSYAGEVLQGVYTFPNSPVGASQTGTVILANELSGSPAAQLTIGGANPGDFTVSAVSPSVSPNPSSSCPVGTAPCTISITFKPTALGTRSAKILLDPPNPPTYEQGQYLLVTGTAVGPGPSFSTSPSGSISLFSYLPGTYDPNSTGKQAISVTNTGTTTLNLAASLFGTNPTDFTVDTSECQSVAPQATCVVNVTLIAADTVNGTVQSAATLFLYDTNSTASATITLNGTTNYWPAYGSLWQPLGPALSYYQFPAQQVNTLSPPLTFTVTDRNGYPLAHPVSIRATSDIVITQGAYCPVTGQPCTVTVQFDPQTTGNLPDYIYFTDTVTGGTTVEEFLGTGTQ